LAEGLGIRAVARVFEVDPNTVLAWLVEAADQLQAFSSYFLHDVQASQVQLDELYAVLGEVKGGELSDGSCTSSLRIHERVRSRATHIGHTSQSWPFNSPLEGLVKPSSPG
jgi:hypothetical protein